MMPNRIFILVPGSCSNGRTWGCWSQNIRVGIYDGAPLTARILVVYYVIDKGYFSEAFLFKPRGGHSPPSGLNRKPRKYPLFSL